MTQLGESIAMPSVDAWSCPFDHHKKKKPPARKHAMPRWEKNDASELGTNLGDEYHYSVRIPIKVNGVKHSAHYTPHHLLPGNASWPKTKLRRWVDKRPGHINGHIGYDVNGFDNGVSLPANAGYTAETGKSWKSYASQADYAFAAMEATTPTNQFHDAHPAYNAFVTNMLDKIAEKLDNQVKKNGHPGCGKKNCAGATKQTKPYNPPYNLMPRLARAALRLEGYLVGSPRTWKMPIYTSRFALMYKMKWSQRKAQKALSDATEAAKAGGF